MPRYFTAKGIQPPHITGDVVISAIPSKQSIQSLTKHWDWLMPALVKLRSYLFERCPHALANGYKPNHKHNALGLITEMETEKIECFGFALSALPTNFDREPAKPQQACFSGCKVRLNRASRTSNACRKLNASSYYSTPSTLSSAYRTAIIPPWLHADAYCLTHKSIT